MPLFIAIAILAAIGACIIFPGLFAIPLVIGIFFIISLLDRDKFG